MTASFHSARSQRLWTAIVTPMLNNGDIDYDSFTQLLLEQERAKNGIVLLGSTGEGANLSSDERRQVIEFACALNLQTPLMVGVGGLEWQAQKDWLRFCEMMPVDAYLMVTPIYAKPGAEGQRRWFESLMDDVTRPCMLYNVPSRAGVALHAQALRYLQNHRNLWAVKEAGGDAEKFAQWQNEFPQIAWYSGDDALFGEHARSGAAGLVSVASNIWPQQVHQWVDDCIAGDAHAAAQLKRIAEPLFSAANPIPTKALLKHLQRISSAQLRLPLSSDDLPSLEPLTQVNAAVIAQQRVAA